MIVELKEKLKPNTLLFWDGNKLVSITRDELLGDVSKRLTQIEEFNTSLLERQVKFEGKIKNRFKGFLGIFRGGTK